MLKLIIFYASHLYWPFALLCLAIFWRGNRRLRQVAAAALAATSILAYARFVEPRLLNIHHETVLFTGATPSSPSIRIAVFGDTHYGIFTNAMPARRIVDAINREKVDAVLLAGDISYYPKDGELAGALAPLANLNAPLYAVLGNHDVGFPGPDLTTPLMRALSDAGALIPTNRALETRLDGHDIIIAGTSDLWQKQQDFRFSAALPDGVPVILLTHNPDTAIYVPDDFPYELMVAGHTHGGQIRIPFIFRSVIPTDYPFDKGLYTYPTPAGDRLVWVTPGTGMVGLPMRFNMRPRIDILTIHLPVE